MPLLDLRRGRARDADLRRNAACRATPWTQAAQRRLFAAALALLAMRERAVRARSRGRDRRDGAAGAGNRARGPAGVRRRAARCAALVGERWQRISILPLALASLRATTLRSLALAATGAVALFGSVALGGSRANLLRGIDSFAHSYVADADIWVTNPGDNQAVDDFSPGDRRRAYRAAARPSPRVQRLPGRLFAARQAPRVDHRPPARRRAAKCSKARSASGNADGAIARLSARRLDRRLQADRRRTPPRRRRHAAAADPHRPRRFRIAATTTNLAWPPGVIFMSTADYSRAWATDARRRRSASSCARARTPRAARSAIEARARAAASGLEVLARGHARATRIDALTSEGLGQLQEISTLLLLAAIVAMVAALASSLWQRRAGLAGLRLSGATRRSLQRHPADRSDADARRGLPDRRAGRHLRPGRDRRLPAPRDRLPAREPARQRAARSRSSLLVLALALALGAIPGWLARACPPVLALADE